MLKAERYVQRMAHKKAVVDAAIAAATQRRGLLLVLTGNGKGKSTSAFGMAARALGHNLQVTVIQFVKSGEATGEERFFGAQTGINWYVCGAGFTWETADRERDRVAARKGWEQAHIALTNPNLHLVILDELTYPLRDNLISIDECLSALAARPPMQHVVITGRSAPNAIIKVADTVTETKDHKHAFRAGVTAQAGIDY
jgi:cob(I)alamin adenosyltransferase